MTDVQVKPWELKTLPLQRLEVKSEDEGGSKFGSFGGYASVFNEIDSYGDTVFPGAYKETIPKFLKEGFISWSHYWDVPIATLSDAEEDHHGLYIKGDFHSTDEAQRARAIAVERIDRGKSMGLSIGFLPKEVVWPDEDDDWYRGLKRIDLFETGLVMVPADKHAQMTEAKSLQRDDEYVANVGDEADFVPGTLRRVGVVEKGRQYTVISGRLKGTNVIEKMSYRYPHSQWTVAEAREHASGVDADFVVPRNKEKIPEHLSRVLDEVTAVNERMANLWDLRVKEGRTISQATRDRLSSIIDNLEKALQTSKGLLEAPEEAGDGEKGVDRRALLQARMALVDATVKLAS